MIHTPTNVTSKKLVYGIEIVLSLYIQRPTMKFSTLIDLPLNQYKNNRFAQLDLLDEKGFRGAEHIEAYQRKVVMHYTKSIIE